MVRSKLSILSVVAVAVAAPAYAQFNPMAAPVSPNKVVQNAREEVRRSERESARNLDDGVKGKKKPVEIRRGGAAPVSSAAPTGLRIMSSMNRGAKCGPQDMAERAQDIRDLSTPPDYGNADPADVAAAEEQRKKDLAELRDDEKKCGQINALAAKSGAGQADDMTVNLMAGDGTINCLEPAVGLAQGETPEIEARIQQECEDAAAAFAAQRGLKKGPKRATRQDEDDLLAPLTPPKRVKKDEDDLLAPLTPPKRSTKDEDDLLAPLTPPKRSTKDEDDLLAPLTPPKRKP